MDVVWEKDEVADWFSFLMYIYEDIPQMPGYPQGTSAVEEIEYVEDPEHKQSLAKDTLNELRSDNRGSVLGVKSSCFEVEESREFLVDVLTAVMKFHHDHHP